MYWVWTKNVGARDQENNTKPNAVVPLLSLELVSSGLHNGTPYKVIGKSPYNIRFTFYSAGNSLY